MCISVVSHGLRISRYMVIARHLSVIFMYISACIHSVCAVNLILVVSSVKRYYFVIQLLRAACS